MSLAILNRLAATVLMAPWLNTMRHGRQGLELVGAVVKAMPVILAMRSATILSKPMGAFRPVPTAVPPWASSISLGMVCSMRAMPLRLAPHSRKFLAQGGPVSRPGVGAADLDDVLPGSDLGGQRRMQVFSGRASSGVDFLGAGDVHGGGKVSLDDWLILT